MSNFIAIGNNEPTPDNLPDEIKKIINDGKKRAGFNPDGTPIMRKPYSQPGEKGTDTNQANEARKIDVRFLVSVVEFYRVGGFDRYDLPIRVANALDSLAEMYPHDIINGKLKHHEINLALKDNAARAKLRSTMYFRKRSRGDSNDQSS